MVTKLPALTVRLMSNTYVIMYGKNQNKLMMYTKNKASRERALMGIWLNFNQEPSVGVIYSTDVKDAKFLVADSRDMGLKSASYLDMDKAKRALQTILGF